MPNWTYNPHRRRAIVALSGGMDSCSLAAVASTEGAESILAVTVQYGSRHNERELRAAQDIMAYFRDETRWAAQTLWDHIVIELNPATFVGTAVKSALLPGGLDVPRAEYAKEGRQDTVVPGRNLQIIAALASIAEARGYQVIYMAMHANDAANYAYPDCTPDFVKAANVAVGHSTLHTVEVAAPFNHLDKSEIAAIGTEFGAPLWLSYSCYEGGTYHCGVCPTCRERQRAFAEAGIEDPTVYNSL